MATFEEIAFIILGTPVSQYDSLDEAGRLKVVDTVLDWIFGKRPNCEEWIRKFFLQPDTSHTHELPWCYIL